ncbi:MAG TPA: SGNH/GDSL hydrolase family protein [Thermoanaerobaculia bacterium]|nr:SGNH/GDSL hydrolase family protein [Thermoanaerobaculia bacterium]
MRRYERFVAIGDSTVEGLDDPDGHGGFHGWADRIAQRLANEQGSILYANLGIRGRTTREVRDEQLAPAIAMRPDLAIVVSGTNDLLRRRFDAVALRDDIESMQWPLIEGGATVLTFTLPDLSAVMPLARMLRSRLLAMNDIIRNASAATGAIVCDFAAYPVAADPRLWSDDRLHANSAGHARMAEALAYHAGIHDDRSWAKPLDGTPPHGFDVAVAAELRWWRVHLLPWIVRHAMGRSSGDGITAKRPELAPVLPSPTPAPPPDRDSRPNAPATSG